MYQMLTNEQFHLIEPLFPKQRKPETIPLRRCLDAICYVLETGCAWRRLPYDYRKKEGDWHTIYARYKRWSESGLLGKILRELEVRDILQVRIAFLDSTTVRAHHAAAGAPKKRGLKRSGDRGAVSRRRST
jgi:transposase